MQAVAGAAAPLDDITIGHLVPAGDTAAAAAAASDDNVIGHAVPAGSGLACDTAAAAATRHQSPGPSCIIKRVAGAARDAVTAASATLAQARSAYWGLGCAVGGPLHVAGAVKYLLPPKYKRVRHTPWLLAECPACWSDCLVVRHQFCSLQK